MSTRRLSAIFRHPAGRGIWLGLVCAVIAWYVGHQDVFRGLEDWMLDGCFRKRGTRPTHSRIIIVGLDEQSIGELNKPISFASPELAVVLAYLKEQQAKAIGLDLFVPRCYSQLADIKLPSGAGYAVPLGKTAEEAGNVVLPEWWSESGWREPLEQWQPTKPRLGDVAYVNPTFDDDHFIRRARLIRDDVPHFGLAVYARSRGAEFTYDKGRNELRVGEEVIPIDAGQNLRINFVGPPNSIPEISFRDVFAAAQSGRPMPVFQGAIVLIGITAWSDADTQGVPFNNNYARVLPGEMPPLMGTTEVHANVISTLSDSAYIRTPPWLESFPWLLGFGALLGAAYARLTPGWGLLLAVTHHIAWEAVALMAFTYFGWRIEMVGMMLLGVLAYGATYTMRWRNLRRTLSVVKSEQVARALEADPRKLSLSLGGKDSIITVLFSDIRGFSTFSETHPAQEVLSLLNAYFSAIVPEIEAEGGTLNTYMGDGIMVLFGAPVEHPDHALRAVRAAVAMLRRVRSLAETWAELGCDDFQIGIGIHTGRAVVGSVGSPGRVDYTAIGDTVNAAARIETENKAFGTQILISSATHAALPEEERQRLGCAATPTATTVKGKQEELFLYPVELKDVPVTAS